MSAVDAADDLVLTPGPIPDFDEFATFVRSVNIAQSGRPRVSRDILEAALSMPDFDPVEDLRLVRDGAGSLVAAEWIQTRRPYVETLARGFVAPERINEGIGSRLLEWVVETARARVPRAPDGARVAVKVEIDPDHPASVALLEGHGFSPRRHFREMRVDFEDAPPSPPPLPDGLRFAPFDPERDLDRTFDAIDEAFRDHYGYVERPREDELARFRRLIEIGTVDPSLVWLVLDGDEVAGTNICREEHEGDTDVGYVANIAVRRPWRRRGLATTMLAVCFDELAGRGKKGVALYVDAGSLTGATRLYESVGMREVSRTALYERRLRSGENLTVA